MDTQLNARLALPVLARTVSGCLNSPFLGLFWTSCGPSFSGHGYPAQRAANTSCPRSDRFRLLELPVSRTFLDQLRPQLLWSWIPSSTRGQDFLSSLGPFPAASTPRFSDFSGLFTAHLFSSWIPSSARGQSRKGPPAFPWCQKVGAPFGSNSAVCVREYPAREGLRPAETRLARVSRPARTSAAVLSPLPPDSLATDHRPLATVLAHFVS